MGRRFEPYGGHQTRTPQTASNGLFAAFLFSCRLVRSKIFAAVLPEFSPLAHLDPKPRPHLWRHPDTHRWYAVWQEHGKTKRASLKTKKRKDAECALVELEATLGVDDWGERPDLALLDAIDEWLQDRRGQHRGLAVTTLSDYKTFANAAKGLFSGRLLARKATPRHVRAALARMAEGGASPRRQAWFLRHLRMVTRWLVKEGEIGRDPAAAVDMPRFEARSIDAMSAERFSELLDQARTFFEAQEGEVERKRAEGLVDLLQVLWLSGLRSVEAYRLTWDDIDLEASVWVIRSPKNQGGVRPFPIHKDLLPILRRRKLLGGRGPFSQTHRKEWTRFKQEVPMWKGTNLHEIRHAFVTRLSAAGHQAAASFLVGHRSAQMTEHYTHLTPEDAREVLDQL